MTDALELARDWYLVEQAEKQNSARADELTKTAANLARRIDYEIVNPLKTLIAERNEDIGLLQGELKHTKTQCLLIADSLKLVMIERDLDKARIAELEAAIDGCAGQWTPMPEGAHYCGCNDEDCTGEWRTENNGSRLVIGDGESELSIEFYEAIRVCWQVQPPAETQP